MAALAVPGLAADSGSVARAGEAAGRRMLDGFT
jgi:hypothetical protein